MSLSQVHYLPLAPPFFFILVGLFVILLVLIQLGVLRYAYMRVALALVQHCSCCLPLSLAAISIFQSRTCPSSVCWHSRRLISLECVMLFQSSPNGRGH